MFKIKQDCIKSSGPRGAVCLALKSDISGVHLCAVEGTGAMIAYVFSIFHDGSTMLHGFLPEDLGILTGFNGVPIVESPVDMKNTLGCSVVCTGKKIRVQTEYSKIYLYPSEANRIALMLLNCVKEISKGGL